ncbi:hypothetical protein F8M41_019281, partial [Gigaspora margarita]
SEFINEDKKSPQLLSNVSNIGEKHMTHDGKEIEIIMLGSDMELNCNDEYIYVDDDDECAYLDHKQWEEQRILEAESSKLFLKYDSQDK